jgi:preprotein translocase subunit SecG
VPDPEPVPDPEAEDEAEEPEEIPFDPVPLVASVDIMDDPVPQAAAGRSWALMNLLCAIGATATALFMAFTMKQKEDDAAAESEEEEASAGMKKSKLLGVLPAAASIVTFILTEDMCLPMAMTDRWTVLMAVFFIAGLALAWATRRGKSDEGSASPAGSAPAGR